MRPFGLFATSLLVSVLQSSIAHAEAKKPLSKAPAEI